MTRSRRGYIARRCRTKTRLCVSTFRGCHSRFMRTAIQQRIRALVSSHWDRGSQRKIFAACGSLE